MWLFLLCLYNMKNTHTLTLNPDFFNSLNRENTRLSYQNDIMGFMELTNVMSLAATTRDDILRWKEPSYANWSS